MSVQASRSGSLLLAQASDFAAFMRRATFDAPALIGSTAAPLAPERLNPERHRSERLALPGLLPPNLSAAHGCAAHSRSTHDWSAWLHASAGVQRVDVGQAVNWAYHQPTPSARCLYPARVSLLTSPPGHPDGLKEGIYRYDALHHALIRPEGASSCRPPLDLLREHLGSPLSGVFGGAAVSIDWGRTHAKYGQFGYRLALLEAGMQAAQLAIVAEALGWHASLLWDFPDETVNLTVGVDLHERVVALVLLRYEPGTVQTPAYQTRFGLQARAPSVPTLPPNLDALDRCTHLRLGLERAPAGAGHPAQVTPTLLGRRDLLRTIRSRHSGDPVFAPVAEDCGAARLGLLLHSAAQPYPLANGARVPDMSLHAVYRDGAELRHVRASAGGLPLAQALSVPDLAAVQPDIPLAHAPLSIWLSAPLPDVFGTSDGPEISGGTEKPAAYGARQYRHLNLEAGVTAQRLLLLAAEHGWAGRASCSYHAGLAQEVLGLPPDELPLLQLTFGREPPSRWAPGRYRLHLRP